MEKQVDLCAERQAVEKVLFALSIDDCMERF